jgi:glycosyltransferase involved in cell wall biosynthesis
MGFASSWLSARSIFPEFIKEAPLAATGIITVVPSCNELSITDLLDSLKECRAPVCIAEVIVVVNAPGDASEEIIKNNRDTINKIRSWKNNNKTFFRLFILDIANPVIRGWGVGLARKTGMDEALRRFDYLDMADGVIACLDADCTVDPGYFVEIEKELLNIKSRRGCSIRFEHPTSGTEYPSEIYNSIIQYEIHLRYYYQALKFSGFPEVFHTVGSSMAVKAVGYMKAGGMNRRQAGEDFYFIQKLIPAGGYFSLNSTKVFPSPRISERVPFGTGNAIGRMIKDDARYFMTYDPRAFSDLKSFFILCLSVFHRNENSVKAVFDRFPESVKLFLEVDEWKQKITEISENTASAPSFRKRFFEWFNMFRIVRFLNTSHQKLYRKIPAGEAAEILMKMAGIRYAGENDADLLQFLRKLEI